jgi:hypothetical protein
MSTIIIIPGGTAELYDPKELTPRRRIPAKSLLNRSDDLLLKLVMARRVTTPDGGTETEDENLPGPDLRLTPHEAEIIEHIKYATAWGYLKSWTLDRPLPASWEDMLDLPDGIADVIVDTVNSMPVYDPAADAEMTLANLENKRSFTGSSDATKTSSKGRGKRRSSPRKHSNS